MTSEFTTINNRIVGTGQPCFIIAEAGVNHNGSLKTALQLVEAASKAEADAVKFQTFNTDLLVTKTAKKAAYQIQSTSDTETQYEMLKALELSYDDHVIIQQRCQELGIIFASTPFDCDSVDFLSSINVPFYKTGSGEITNLPLLSHIATKGKPVIISTGMSTIEEIRLAITTVLNSDNNNIALLHCISNYPADPCDANLRAISEMNNEFGVPIGFSDHTLGNAISIAAVAMGACVIEKHFTLSNRQTGPDHSSSLEPQELSKLVKDIRSVESALGTGHKAPSKSEEPLRASARRSLIALHRIPRGTKIERQYIDIKRPGTGLSPEKIGEIIGKTTKNNIPAGTLISMEMIV